MHSYYNSLERRKKIYVAILLAGNAYLPLKYLYDFAVYEIDYFQ